jgi:alkylation response protein AidB-like acyl-CoA dehydrogenase
VERLYRELRVDRIWEGTSEIQRTIVLNELRKRGPAAYTEWP